MDGRTLPYTATRGPAADGGMSPGAAAALSVVVVVIGSWLAVLTRRPPAPREPVYPVAATVARPHAPPASRPVPVAPNCETLCQSLRAMHFDDPRLDAVRAFIGARQPADPPIRLAELADITACFSFDANRGEAVRAVAPHLGSGLRWADAQRVVDTFSFDDGKDRATAELRPHVADPPAN